MKKESAELHVMWHVNCMLHAFPITIVTTIDAQGRINAAPGHPILLVSAESPDAAYLQ